MEERVGFRKGVWEGREGWLADRWWDGWLADRCGGRYIKGRRSDAASLRVRQSGWRQHHSRPLETYHRARSLYPYSSTSRSTSRRPCCCCCSSSPREPTPGTSPSRARDLQHHRRERLRSRDSTRTSRTRVISREPPSKHLKLPPPSLSLPLSPLTPKRE